MFVARRTIYILRESNYQLDVRILSNIYVRIQTNNIYTSGNK